MAPNEAEKAFLEGSLRQIDAELQYRENHFRQDYPPDKALPEGADALIFRCRTQREIVQLLLSEETDMALEDRILTRLTRAAQDQVDEIKSRLGNRAHSDSYWSNEFYIQLLREILAQWSEVNPAGRHNLPA